MKPKEKARELILKMWDSNPNRIYDKTKELTEDNYLGIDDAIGSALICIEEIFELGVFWNDKQMVKDYPQNYQQESTYEFWQEVENEINRL